MQSCGIYARISSDDGTALGAGRQVDDCTAEALRRGWPVAQVFTDNDVSATKAKRRPEYELLLAAIESRTIDALVVYDVDRLTRTPAELERFIDLADRHHIALASVGGDVDLATPQGRLTARIKGSVARHEVEQMSRRLKRKFEENAKEGKAHGVTPFGYRKERVLDENGRDVGYREVIHEAEAEGPLWNRHASQHQRAPPAVLRLPRLHEADEADGTGPRGAGEGHGGTPFPAGCPGINGQ